MAQTKETTEARQLVLAEQLVSNKDKINELYRCYNCFQVMLDPYKAVCCEKDFCKKCIDKRMSGLVIRLLPFLMRCPNAECPKKFCYYKNSGLQRVIMNLKIYCKYRSRGCQWSGKISSYDRHLLYDCSGHKLDCPIKGCQIKCLRRNIADHLNYHYNIMRAREAERVTAETTREEEQTRQQKSEIQRQEAEIRQQVAEREREIANTRLQESEREKCQGCACAERSEAKLRACESELQQLHNQTSSWVVKREEIQVTGQEIGRGAWATVSVATFRGTRVAAKVIRQEIICQYNSKFVKREMNMAARIRHPNLVQFIGATLEGEIVILTELMPTSLRRELMRACVSQGQATFIGLDVARALNYLHLMRPHPLIHRDISSANVLLEPLPNNHWRAKVSDYGTVNILEQLHTPLPGNPCYAAPEAYNPILQSPKMDMYSFGALLLEMLTGELPSPEERGRLLRKVMHQRLLALIQRCLSKHREDRPTANDIIFELDL